MGLHFLTEDLVDELVKCRAQVISVAFGLNITGSRPISTQSKRS